MQLKGISVKVTRKKPMEQFGAVSAEFSTWADLDEGEDSDDAARRLWQMANANVRAELAVWEAKQTAKLTELFLGLPVALRDQIIANLQAAEQAEPAEPGNGNGTAGA